MMEVFHKKIIAWVLLLVIIGGVVLWQTGYLKPVLSRLKAMVAPELPLAEEADLDLSEVDIESLLEEGGEEPSFAEATEGKEPAFSPEEASPAEGGPTIVFEPKIGQIQEKINEISKEVERIDREVKKMIALAEIQKEIVKINEKISQLGQELEKLS